MTDPFCESAVACWLLVAEWDRLVRVAAGGDGNHGGPSPGGSRDRVRPATSRPASMASSSLPTVLSPPRAASARSASLRQPASLGTRPATAASIHSSADSLATSAYPGGGRGTGSEVDSSTAWKEWDEWVEEAIWRLAVDEARRWESAVTASTTLHPLATTQPVWTRTYVARFISPWIPASHPASISSSTPHPTSRAARWAAVLRHHVRTLVPSQSSNPDVTSPLDSVPNVGVSLFPLPANSLYPASLYVSQLAALLPFPRAVDASDTERQRYKRWE
ncbi:hypothetical protein HDU93_003047, partial [Gonapodya sp. JEL0774]